MSGLLPVSKVCEQRDRVSPMEQGEGFASAVYTTCITFSGIFLDELQIENLYVCPAAYSYAKFVVYVH